MLGWYRRAKATKRGGWAARGSECLIVPPKRGNCAHETPWRGKGAPAGGTVGGKDGQHTEVGSRLHVTTTDSRTGQTSLRDGGGHRLASWTSGYATARSEAVCRGAGCGRTRTSGSVGGQGQQRPWSTRPRCFPRAGPPTRLSPSVQQDNSVSSVACQTPSPGSGSHLSKLSEFRGPPLPSGLARHHWNVGLSPRMPWRLYRTSPRRLRFLAPGVGASSRAAASKQ